MPGVYHLCFNSSMVGTCAVSCNGGHTGCFFFKMVFVFSVEFISFALAFLCQFLFCMQCWYNGQSMRFLPDGHSSTRGYTVNCFLLYTSISSAFLICWHWNDYISNRFHCCWCVSRSYVVAKRTKSDIPSTRLFVLTVLLPKIPFIGIPSYHILKSSCCHFRIARRRQWSLYRCPGLSLSPLNNRAAESRRAKQNNDCFFELLPFFLQNYLPASKYDVLIASNVIHSSPSTVLFSEYPLIPSFSFRSIVDLANNFRPSSFSHYSEPLPFSSLANCRTSAKPSVPASSRFTESWRGSGSAREFCIGQQWGV